MLQSISSMDGANESFYHGMVLGLCAILGNRYQIRSNRESGLGRFDIQLNPLVKGIPGFLFEFKHTNDDHVDLDALADRALQQIDAKKYDTELQAAGVRPIIKITKHEGGCSCDRDEDERNLRKRKNRQK